MAAPSELESEMQFLLVGKEAAETLAGYDKLAFAVFARDSIKKPTCCIWIQRTTTSRRSRGRAIVRRKRRNNEADE